MKLKRFCVPKDTVIQAKRQPIEWGKNLYWLYIWQRLVSRIYKELKKKQTEHQENKQFNLKMGYSAEVHFQKRRHHWLRKTSKVSASLVIRASNVKTTWRFHPVRMAKLNKTNLSTCYWGCREKAAPLCFWWESKLVHALRKYTWRFLKMLKTDLPQDRTVPMTTPSYTENLAHPCSLLFYS